jgi:hypothetical protein
MIVWWVWPRVATFETGQYHRARLLEAFGYGMGSIPSMGQKPQRPPREHGRRQRLVASRERCREHSLAVLVRGTWTERRPGPTTSI